MIAEGVESPVEIESLNRFGITAAQGYRRARPLTLEAPAAHVDPAPPGPGRGDDPRLDTVEGFDSRSQSYWVCPM